MSFQIPVLFIVFNRIEQTKSVFEAIRLVKPLKLYIAADGDRKHVPNEYQITIEIHYEGN